MDDPKLWVPVVVQLLIAAFIYGGLFVKVKYHDSQIEKLQASDQRQWSTLEDHKVAVARLQTESTIHRDLEVLIDRATRSRAHSAGG